MLICKSNVKLWLSIRYIYLVNLRVFRLDIGGVELFCVQTWKNKYWLIKILSVLCSKEVNASKLSNINAIMVHQFQL